ncbi:hypothetical protein HDE_11392 [Halotydeus destructor]|nr:hypothetical protein HDE_11392 [Halotydeus destructor]
MRQVEGRKLFTSASEKSEDHIPKSEGKAKVKFVSKFQNAITRSPQTTESPVLVLPTSWTYHSPNRTPRSGFDLRPSASRHAPVYRD